MNSSFHTIRKQTLQFQYNGNADGFALQKEVSDWCNFTLIPEIEQQLDSLDLGENFVTIDRLEIEATADNNDWKQKIRNELISSLKQKLIDFKPKFKEEVGNKAITRSGKLDELILFYFENGYFPWWRKAIISDNFETIFLNWISEELPPSRADFIRKELRQKAYKTLIERILNQVPQELFFQFLKNIYKKEVEILGHTESFLKEVIVNNISTTRQKAFSLSIYRFLLTMMIEYEGIMNTDVFLQFVYQEAKKNITAAKIFKPSFERYETAANPIKIAWQQLLREDKRNLESGTKKKQLLVVEPIATKEQNQEEKEIPEIVKKENRIHYNRLIDKLTNPESAKQSKDKLAIALQEGIYLDNAGAIIFAVFLPTLFKKLELEKEGMIQNPHLATLLIQYCVTGNAKIAEYELVLPKVLCGLDVEFPVNTNVKIKDDQIKEVNEMLYSLIEYWSVLKNTSIGGLRESFFMRNGKLSILNNEWLLQVEQKPFDMLLQQLPWSISMIKLPWMTNLLVTEWV